MTLKQAQLVKVRGLRQDARRLETVANHLRLEAKEIIKQIKADATAEKMRKQFYDPSQQQINKIF